MNQRQAARQACAALADAAREHAREVGQQGLPAADSARLRAAFERLADELTRRSATSTTLSAMDHPTLDLQFDHDA